jgi:hypothetical protein
MRLYAIRADAERAITGGADDAITNFQDDFDPESEKNKSLEDCARQLNRIFNTCLSDRYTILVSCILMHRLANNSLELLWHNLVNGGSTTPLTCYSRRTFG